MDIHNTVIHKGRLFLIQETETKGEEVTYLNFFMGTATGTAWREQNQAIKIIPSESPDFIFETAIGKRIGLEITKLVVKTDKFIATATLQSIAEQICQHFKTEKGIALSILIDIYDERKWSTNWKEHLGYLYDPGFKCLKSSKKDIKNAIIDAISKAKIKPLELKKLWIDIGSQKFCVTVDRMFEPHTSATVNNAGICKEDPFEELQNAISAKNGKFETYRKNSDECDLLVVFDDSNGNYALFTDEINTYEFISSFRNVYLLDFFSQDNIIAIPLKIKPTI